MGGGGVDGQQRWGWEEEGKGWDGEGRKGAYRRSHIEPSTQTVPESFGIKMDSGATFFSLPLIVDIINYRVGRRRTARGGGGTREGETGMGRGFGRGGAGEASDLTLYPISTETILHSEWTAEPPVCFSNNSGQKNHEKHK